MTRIAIFASGSGSNAQQISEYFADNCDVEISFILSNKKDAYVLERAKNLGIPSAVFSRKDFYSSDRVLNLLKDIDLVVLAGFLWLIPENILSAFPNKIINIHPALLPKFGGKGMYGQFVHKAVVEAKEKETGITIHLVNSEYDKGEILFQEKFPVLPNYTADDVAAEIHKLEYKYFPKVIEDYCLR